MSQREIAAATGVTQMTVSRDLRDETFVSPPTVELAGQPPFGLQVVEHLFHDLQAKQLRSEAQRTQRRPAPPQSRPADASLPNHRS